MKTQKLTKVQEQIMARFERGQKLVFMPTNRMSGDAIFWVYVDNGDARVIEKALYPQLRRLLWMHMIEDGEHIVDPAMLTFDECDFGELHRAGCIGF